MNGSFSLSAPMQLGMTPLGPVTKADNAPPVRRYVKPIIRLGTFVHPVKGWKLDVTDQRMDGWVAEFERMKANGVPVKLTKDHKRNQADAVVGNTVDLTRSGDWLNAIVEVTGEKNIALVEANKDVSVEIDETYRDGTGNQYQECITAVSIVQNPIVPGQTGFRIAAGMDDDDRPTLFLSNGAPVMKKLFGIIAATAALVGLQLSADTMTEDTAADAVGKIKGKVEGLEGEKLELTKKLSLATEEHQPDTKYLSLAARSIDKEIDSLKGTLSDKGVAELKKELIGDLSKKEFSSFLLSADSEEDGVAAVERIVKIIKENPGLRRGSATEHQKHLSVDDPHAGGDSGDKAPTPERLKEILTTTQTGLAILADSKK